MSELITQYTPYIFAVIAAIAVFAAGHFAGSSSAVTAKPIVPTSSDAFQVGALPVVVGFTPSKIVDPIKAAEDTKPLIQVPGEVLPVLAKEEVKADAPIADSLDKILPAKVAEEVKAPAAPATNLDIEVAKAHDALDKAGVFGPNRLIAIAAVRAGQVTGDDVARAHPVQQEAKVPFGAIGLPSQDTTVATSAAPGQAE